MTTVAQLFASSRSVIHLDPAGSSAPNPGPPQLTVRADEIAAQAQPLADQLIADGLEPGDRVAVWAPNGLGYLLTLAACATAGFVVVSVNTRYSATEAHELIVRSGAKAVVTSPENVARLEELESDSQWLKVPLPLATAPIGSLERLEAPTHTEAPTPTSPFVVFTTSGTTNKPKMVLHQHHSIYQHAHDVARTFELDAESRIMLALPLCGVFGLATLTSALAADASVWIPTAFDADAVAQQIARHHIDVMHGADEMFHRMLTTGHDLSSIRLGGYARFNPSLSDIARRADEVGITLTGLYGMSEVQALYLLQDPSGPIERREVGGGNLVSPQAEARIVNPDTGEPLPAGTDGEMELRGPSLFAGYLAEGGGAIDTALTDSAHRVDPNGTRWFASGDLGRLEEDGTISYLTRMGDVLRLGGFLVSPAEIESVLLEFDEIADVQVVTVSLSEGVRPVAMVIPSQSNGQAAPIDETAVIAHCQQRLARFKAPIRIVPVAEFPVTLSANGTKIQRNKLQQMAQTIVDGAN